MSAVCYWPREPRYHRDVLDNAGPAYRLLHWWQDQCSAAWAAGDRKRLAELRGLSFQVGTHPGMLHLAYEYRRVYGGRAPGLDDVTYEDLAECDPWLVCRKLSAALRSEQYPVDDPRPVWITKPSGGLRLLSLFSIVDRIIGRALASTLTPLIAPGFSPDTFGGLPHRGPPAAFAAAFQIVREQQAWVWVANDVRKAFDAVPRGRLFDLFARYPAPLVRLLKQLSKTLQPNGKGVCQGGPMSMLLLHVYLDHFLDQKLRAEFPALRLLRYADDVLVPCNSRQQAQEVDAFQRKCLQDAGLQLKFSADAAIADLNQGGHTDWLGMRIRRGDLYLLDGEITEEAWISLAGKLRRMEVKQVAMKHRRSAVRSWLGYFTLCYRRGVRDDVPRRLVRLAKVHGVGGLSASDLRVHWRDAWLTFVEQMRGEVLHPRENT